ncbi:MAG: hypothetical protein AAGC55_08815, partial [Myxococcota bacterium]
MNSVRVGFFAVSAEHLHELRELEAQWIESLEQRRDDVTVRRSAVYRHARDVAWAAYEIPSREACRAYVALLAAFHRKAWPRPDQEIFSAE